MEDKQKSQQESKSILLEAGAAASQKMYQALLMRIKAGEPLKRSEYRLFKELERDIEGPTGAEKVEGFGAAAEYCGVSKRTISYHLKRGSLKQNADGTFDHAVLDEWLAKYGRKKADKDLAQRRLLADLHYRLARAEREQILVKQLKGELFHADEISEAWAFRLTEFTAALQSLIDRLPAQLVDRERGEIQEIIETEIYQIRERLSRDGRYTPVEAV
jgi:hypothetical protein